MAGFYRSLREALRLWTQNGQLLSANSSIFDEIVLYYHRPDLGYGFAKQDRNGRWYRVTSHEAKKRIVRVWERVKEELREEQERQDHGTSRERSMERNREEVDQQSRNRKLPAQEDYIVAPAVDKHMRPMKNNQKLAPRSNDNGSGRSSSASLARSSACTPCIGNQCESSPVSPKQDNVSRV